MDFIIKFLEDLQSFVTSEKVLALISGASTIYFVLSAFINKISKKKIKIENDTLQKTLKVVDENYNKYVVNSENTINEFRDKYLEATKLVENIVESMKKQNEALEIAFNNSNLNASAKLLVQEKLKNVISIEKVEKITKIATPTEDENKKVDEKSTQMILEEVNNEQKQGFIRIK